MTQFAIQLTLAGESRTVGASVSRVNPAHLVVEPAVELVTSHGKKTHLGTLKLRFVEGKTSYNERDIADASYYGMLGSGYGRLSTFRSIRFQARTVLDLTAADFVPVEDPDAWKAADDALIAKARARRQA